MESTIMGYTGVYIGIVEKKMETTIMGYIGVYIRITAKKMETTIIDCQLVTCSRSFVPEVVAADPQRRGHPGLHRLGLQICALARRKDPQQKRSLQVRIFFEVPDDASS